ncbi:hypothetical protein VitviT2T_003882 [Vitis vinifera]|uniref:Pentatricopeptide repeat-containing protein n=1 Tax=Vitis vinifera TaxID=29760 RepID=A0ABY9BND3_VITVI|nr:hypothetical protein VitviT2T_003882 [Vitis vinifera]
MEPALEWLFKLYSLGLIRGVIDGKEMIEAVWKSASSGEDVVDLAVLKVIFSVVRFPVVEVPNGSKLCNLLLALQLHGFAEKFDFGMDTCVETSVLNMYIKCGAMDFAQKVFCRTPNPSLFCWNSMIYGYSKYGSVKKALELFAKMPERDTVSWNTMISILSQHGFGAETLNTFLEMWNQGFRPNSMTYASVLSACTSIYDLEWGAHLHARIVRMEPRLDVYAGCGLIDMYAKSGRLEFARQVFDGLTEPNAVSWTSLIGGVAQAGFQEEALVLFNQMREVPVASDQFTLATILGVCLSQIWEMCLIR